MGGHPRWGLALVAIACCTQSAVASADGLRVYASAAAGMMLGGDQLGYLGYDGIAGRASGAVGYALSEIVVLEAHAAAALFGSSGRDGSLFELGGGGRLDVRLPFGRARWSPWAHVDLGITGRKYRPALDLGMALFFDLSPSWALGPIVQYGRVIQPDGPEYSTDANYFTGGLGVAWRPAPARTAVAAAPRRLLSFEPATTERATRTPSPPRNVEPSPEVLLLVEKATGSLTSEVDMIPPILFEFDSVAMIPCGEASLYYARDAVKAARGPVVIEGHADGTGDEPYNVALARRRAEYVRDWLARHGVQAGRMRVEVYGEARQLAEESDGAQRQINRRVIIRLLEPP